MAIQPSFNSAGGAGMVKAVKEPSPQALDAEEFPGSLDEASVLSAIAVGCNTVQEIVNNYGLAPDRVARAIRGLYKKGRVERNFSARTRHGDTVVKLTARERKLRNELPDKL